MLKEAAKWDTKRFKKNGTDVDIFEWNVDRFFEDMWDKIYSSLTEGAEDSVDNAKHSKKMYHFTDVSGAPEKWDKPGFDTICVYQKDIENLKFVESLAKKFHLDYAYNYNKYREDDVAIVVYIPSGARVEDYIQYEPEYYRKSLTKSKAAAFDQNDDEVDDTLLRISKVV